MSEGSGERLRSTRTRISSTGVTDSNNPYKKPYLVTRDVKPDISKLPTISPSSSTSSPQTATRGRGRPRGRPASNRGSSTPVRGRGSRTSESDDKNDSETEFTMPDLEVQSGDDIGLSDGEQAKKNEVKGILKRGKEEDEPQSTNTSDAPPPRKRGRPPGIKASTQQQQQQEKEKEKKDSEEGSAEQEEAEEEEEDEMGVLDEKDEEWTVGKSKTKAPKTPGGGGTAGRPAKLSPKSKRVSFAGSESGKDESSNKIMEEEEGPPLITPAVDITITSELITGSIMDDNLNKSEESKEGDDQSSSLDQPSQLDKTQEEAPETPQAAPRKRGRPPGPKFQQQPTTPASTTVSDNKSKVLLASGKPLPTPERPTTRERRKEPVVSIDKDKDKDKDDRSFERFYERTKEACVVSERWSFGGVLWDPTKKMKMMAVSEIDVTSSGNVRLKRCVQVYEDLTVKIFIEGADMSHTFAPSGSVKGPNDVAQLIHKVSTAKICTGIKNFGPTDKIYFPHCVLRGETYYAPECPVVIDQGVVGPLCVNCNRLRNTIQRRNVKETTLLYSKFDRPPVKHVKSKFAKVLYSVLTDLVEASSVDAKKERKKLRRMIPANAKEYPFQPDSNENSESGDGHTLQFASQHQLQQMLANKQLQIHPGQLQPGSTINIGGKEIRIGKSYGDQSDMMTINVVSGSGQKSAYKVSDRTYPGSSGSYQGQGSLSQGDMQVVEQFVLGGHDVGNVIFQNQGGDFTLAEGQEYELIGEADSSNPIQVLEVLKDENDPNNAIEIIEVDDQTLAQLTSQSHNMSNLILQEPTFEVQEIDVNDPNFRHLVKAFNPSSTVVYQQ